MIVGRTIIKSHDAALIMDVVGSLVPLQLVLLVLFFESVLQLIEYPIILSPLVERGFFQIARLFSDFLFFHVLETCRLKIYVHGIRRPTVLFRLVVVVARWCSWRRR